MKEEGGGELANEDKRRKGRDSEINNKERLERMCKIKTSYLQESVKSTDFWSVSKKVMFLQPKKGSLVRNCLPEA